MKSVTEKSEQSRNFEEKEQGVGKREYRTVPEVIGEARRTGVGVSVGVGVGVSAEGRGFESVILEARAVPVCDSLIL